VTPRNDDGPRAAQRESRQRVDIAPQPTDSASVRRGAVKGRRRRAARRREALTCRVSLLEPSQHRRWWHYLCRRPACGSPHLGRSRDLAGVTGMRRLPCGHWVTIVVARTYGQMRSGAAA
jgi:hypothetical protein